MSSSPISRLKSDRRRGSNNFGARQTGNELNIQVRWVMHDRFQCHLEIVVKDKFGISVRAVQSRGICTRDSAGNLIERQDSAPIVALREDDRVKRFAAWKAM